MTPERRCAEPSNVVATDTLQLLRQENERLRAEVST